MADSVQNLGGFFKLRRANPIESRAGPPGIPLAHGSMELPAGLVQVPKGGAEHLDTLQSTLPLS